MPETTATADPRADTLKTTGDRLRRENQLTNFWNGFAILHDGVSRVLRRLADAKYVQDMMPGIPDVVEECIESSPGKAASTSSWASM